MDFFDRILPGPIRTEEFTFHSDQSPEVLVGRMRDLFEKTRGLVFSPNLCGEFTSAYGFKAQPKWSLLVINKGQSGPAVRMKGEVSAYGGGSLVSIELIPHWTLGVLALFPPLVALIWLIAVPKSHLADITVQEVMVPFAFVLFFPAFSLTSAWVAKRLFKRNFMSYFKLTPIPAEP